MYNYISEIDECFKRFNKECASNARCDVTNPDYPECVCNEGFHGDGRRRCDINTSTAKITTTTTVTVPPRVMIANKDSSEEPPFRMHSWHSVEQEAASTVDMMKTTTMATTTTTRRTYKGSKVPVAKDYDDTSKDITTEAKLDDSSLDMSSSKLLLYILLKLI